MEERRARQSFSLSDLEANESARLELLRVTKEQAEPDVWAHVFDGVYALARGEADTAALIDATSAAGITIERESAGSGSHEQPATADAGVHQSTTSSASLGMTRPEPRITAERQTTPAAEEAAPKPHQEAVPQPQQKKEAVQPARTPKRKMADAWQEALSTLSRKTGKKQHISSVEAAPAEPAVQETAPPKQLDETPQVLQQQFVALARDIFPDANDEQVAAIVTEAIRQYVPNVPASKASEPAQEPRQIPADGGDGVDGVEFGTPKKAPSDARPVGGDPYREPVDPPDTVGQPA